MSIEITMLKNAEYACMVENWIIDYENEKGCGINRLKVEKGEDFPGIYAFKNDMLIGGLTFCVQNDWLFLHCGFVLPEYRGKRIYSTFLHELEIFAKKSKLSGIHVSTYSFEAPHIYEHLGFRKGAALKDLPKGNTSIDYYKYLRQEKEDADNE